MKKPVIKITVNDAAETKVIGAAKEEAQPAPAKETKHKGGK